MRFCETSVMTPEFRSIYVLDVFPEIKWLGTSYRGQRLNISNICYIDCFISSNINEKLSGG
jgi:hypothetical protein